MESSLERGGRTRWCVLLLRNLPRGGAAISHSQPRRNNNLSLESVLLNDGGTDSAVTARSDGVLAVLALGGQHLCRKVCVFQLKKKRYMSGLSC